MDGSIGLLTSVSFLETFGDGYMLRNIGFVFPVNG